MKNFNEGDLERRLQGLPPAGRIVFAASCALRLWPAYVTFHSKTNWGNPNTIRAALDWIWEKAIDSSLDRSECQRHLDEVMPVIPGETVSGDPLLRSFAEDAGAATAYALRVCLDNKPMNAVWAARRVYEALDKFVINANSIDTNRPGAEREILSHRLIQGELVRQQRDLDELEHMTSAESKAMAERLKARAEDESALAI